MSVWDVGQSCKQEAWILFAVVLVSSTTRVMNLSKPDDISPMELLKFLPW